MFIQGPSSTKKPQATLENEILYYRTVAMRSPDVNVDVLEYWRGQSKTLPQLATLARYIVCLPTSSGNPDIIGMTRGDIIQPGQNPLNSADPERFIFCHENFFKLRPFVTTWELDEAENFSGSDTSGSSLSDSEQRDEQGNTYKILKSLLGKKSPLGLLVMPVKIFKRRQIAK